MDSSIVTYLVVAAFVVILGISYIRFKKREEDGILQQPNTDIKQTMSEVRDYFGYCSHPTSWGDSSSSQTRRGFFFA